MPSLGHLAPSDVETTLGRPLVSALSCVAVLNDGTVHCWGDVTQVLNGGTTLHSGYALRVTLDGTTPLTGVKQLALGTSHACALVEASAGNEVWCWGYDRGNLGLGTATGNGNSQYPKKIAGPAESNPNCDRKQRAAVLHDVRSRRRERSLLGEQQQSRLGWGQRIDRYVRGNPDARDYVRQWQWGAR